MSIIKCCYKCPNREVGCHSVCADYIREKAENDAIRERINKQKMEEVNLNSYMKQAHDNLRRDRKRINT